METMMPHLPAVLQQPHGNSISMERALKQIHKLLLEVPTESNDTVRSDVAASLDDVEIMLKAIFKG